MKPSIRLEKITDNGKRKVYLILSDKKGERFSKLLTRVDMTMLLRELFREVV